jgi:hypothetical protein
MRIVAVLAVLLVLAVARGEPSSINSPDVTRSDRGSDLALVHYQAQPAGLAEFRGRVTVLL